MRVIIEDDDWGDGDGYICDDEDVVPAKTTREFFLVKLISDAPVKFWGI